MSREQWFPYVNNGGTTISIAGNDFCVVAADTRMSNGFNISSRIVPKVVQLTDKCILASSGMQADIATLHKLLKARIQNYEYQNGKTISTPAIAQMLSNTLYYKRFFPYYTFNILGGLDEKGVGAVYHFDAVGSYERLRFSSSGSGEALIQPLLDNQVGKQNQLKDVTTTITSEQAINLVKDALTSAGERDIYTGDYVDICIITAEGIKKEKFELKFD